MKNVIFVIGVLLSWYGCSDDNTGTLPISVLPAQLSWMSAT